MIFGTVANSIVARHFTVRPFFSSCAIVMGKIEGFVRLAHKVFAGFCIIHRRKFKPRMYAGVFYWIVAAIVVAARSNFSIIILPGLGILHTRAEQNRQHSDNFSKKTQSPVHYKKLNEKLKQFRTMKKQSFS